MPPEIFTGSDIPSLLERARAELGGEAVILSVRRLGRGAGFELSAARPGAVVPPRPSGPKPTRLAPTLGSIAARAVYRRGAAVREAARGEATREPARPATVAAREPAEPKAVATPWPAPPRARMPHSGALLDMTPRLGLNPAARRRGPAVVALVGPTGAGKTTTLAKLARHPRVFDGLPVGLLCLDTYRVGALEQLRIYAEIARVPLEAVYEAADLERAQRRLRHCEVVLVDTAGRGPTARRDMDATASQLKLLCPAEVHLTLPAGLQPRLARRVLDDHRIYGVTHLLATKLDEFPDDDSVFALAAEAGLPMRWWTDGQEVPMDLQPAAPRLLEGGRATFPEGAARS
jgi:flagellar biosynthesis protein FlhF